MELGLKRLQMCFLFLFCGCVALSQGVKVPGVCVRIGVCTILEAAKHSMTESRILDELAEAAMKNKGGNKAIKGIKGLKVKDIRPPKIWIWFSVSSGMCMTVFSNITIAGKSFIGGTMEITVASNMTTNSKINCDKSGRMTFQVTKCNVELLSCKTNLPSSMLPKIVNKFLNSTLGKVLPGMMCPAADKVIDAMKKKSEAMYDTLQVGNSNRGTCQYSIRDPPLTNSGSIYVCFKVQMRRRDGTPIEIATEPQVSEAAPELGSDNSDIVMPVTVINAAMELYTADLNQDVSSNSVAGLPPISRDALLGKLPGVDIPQSAGELMFKIRSARTPTWSLVPKEANLMIALTIELVSVQQQTTVFFSISTTVKLSATFRLGSNKMEITLGAGSLESTVLISSTIGQFDVELLSSYLLDIVTLTSIASFKIALEDQLPFPSLMGASYGHSVIDIEKDALRITVTSNCELNDFKVKMPTSIS